MLRLHLSMADKKLLLAILLSTAAVANAAWPTFRGPQGDGTVPPHADGSARSLPTEWSEDKNIAWKTEVAGRAWSTPVVAEGKVWLSNATEDGKQMSAVCLDLETGKKLHDKVLFKNADPEPLGNPVNGYGSPSPAVEPGRVYIHFGSYGTACLDTRTYDVIWQRRDLPCRHYRGPGSSVVLWKDTVILTMDGVDVQYLVALDKKTGDTVWKADRTTDFKDLDADGKPKMEGDLRKAYTTPLFVDVAGKTQMVSTGAKATFGYDPDTGKELWTLTYNGFSNAAMPVAGDGHLYINTGFGKPTLLKVRIDDKMKGDITESHVVWEQTRRQPKKPSPLFANGHYFCVEDAGMFSAIHPKSEEPLFTERLWGKFSASPIVSGDHIYHSNEQGNTYVVAAKPTFEVISDNKLDDGCLASPAVAGDSIILRTTTHVYRIAN